MNTAAAIKELEAVTALANACDPSEEHVRTVENWMERRGYHNRDPHGFRELARYLAWKRNGGNQGVLLVGGNGAGKTHVFQTVLSGLRVLPSSRIVRRWRDEGGEATIAWVNGDEGNLMEYPKGYFDVVLDDIGAEPLLNDFGTKVQVMSDVLQERYILWKNRLAMTHITTNLSDAQFAEIYGSRTFSRVMEMCRPVFLSAADARLELVQ